MIKRNITKCFIILSLLLILFVTIPMVSANQTGQDTCDNQYLTDNQDIDNHQDIITNDMEKQSYETNIKKEAEENNIYASADAQATGSGTYEDPYNITNAFNSTNYNQKDKIIVKEGTYNLKKVLTIAKSTANLTITSEGQVILNGLNSNAILDIKTDNTITIENIIFTNGTLESSNGGAIINAANLTINNCNFTNNKASSAGAIYNNKGMLTINNSCFESNEATGSGTNGYSGCIQNAQGNCTISNSKFINNVAGSRAGVSYNNKGNLTFDTNNIIENNTGLFGGALYNYQGTLNIINNNTFRGNYITNNYAGVLHNDNGNVTIKNGKVIYVKVVDGVATATYDVPLDMSGKELNITAVYSGSSTIGKLTAGTTVTVEQATPTLTITPFEEAVPTGSTVTLKAKVALAETPITTGKIVFKINGKTVKDANGKVIYAKLDSNGEVSVDYNLGDLKANTYTVEAVFIASGYDRLESNTTLTVVKA